MDNETLGPQFSGPAHHQPVITSDKEGGYRAACPDCGWSASSFDRFAGDSRNRSNIGRTARSHRDAAMKYDAKKAARAAAKAAKT